MTGLRALAVSGALVALSVSPSARTPVTVVEHVVVVDSVGSPIAGLPAGAFQVLVDGTPRPVRSVSGDPIVLAAIALVDVTASMPAAFGSVRKSLDSELISFLRPGDRLRFGAVSGSPTLSPSSFTGDAKLLRHALGRLDDIPDEQRYGPSPVWDTVALAAAALSQEEGRRVVLLITDGRSGGNRLLFDDMVRQAFIANVAVSVIGEGAPTVISQTRTTAAAVRPELALQRLARDTGGVYYADSRAQARGGSGVDTVELVRRILTEWRHTYTLTFDIEADAQFHRLEVRVDRPGAAVRARTAFLAK